MPKDYQELSRQLQRMEEEMRALDWWSEVPPAPDAMASTAPFCHDRMEFHQWLQWVLIPGFRQLVEQQSPLPGKCAIAPMAEIAWREEDPARVRTLVRVLDDFDRQVTNH
jgi:uncharacterized protein YqcC (DUF446 family)